MTDLDADCRALLDLGRDGLGPDPATVARLRSRVEATVVVAGGATAAAGFASKLGLTTAKLIVLATTAVTLTTAAVVVHVRANVAVMPVAVTADHAPPPVIAKPARRPDPVVAPPPVIPPPPPPVRVATAHRAPPAPPPPRASLTRETELVDLATAAMRSGDLATLRATVQVYARETGNAGQLAEDIAAIEVEALCRANDSDAPTRLAAFDARWPHAGQRQRLTAACKGTP